jgi:hypothetical protein
MTGILSRRLFVRSAGLAAAAAAPAALASAAEAAQGDDVKARLQRLEDEKAVRALQQAWVKQVNARAWADAAKLFADPAKAKADPTLRSLAVEAGEGETIEIAADGMSARLQQPCAALTEAPVEGRGTLLDMARLQGEVVRRTERRLITLAAVKGDSGWRIESVDLRPI